MRVFVCYANDKEVESYIKANALCGNVVQEDSEGCMVTHVLNDGSCWRAPDAVFQDLGSGLFVFDEKGRPQRIQ